MDQRPLAGPSVPTFYNPDTLTIPGILCSTSPSHHCGQTLSCHAMILVGCSDGTYGSMLHQEGRMTVPNFSAIRMPAPK